MFAESSPLIAMSERRRARPVIALSPLVSVTSMRLSGDALMMGTATGVLGFTFGVLADAAGFDLPRIVVMSAFVFNGPCQFAAVGVINDGGTGGGAVGSGMLMAARNALYGPVVRRWVPPRTRARLGAAHFMLDSTTAMALAQTERRDSAGVFWFMGVTLWLFWTSGSLVGALFGSSIGTPEAWGIDAAFPAISIGLLAPHLGTAGGRTARAGGDGGGPGSRADRRSWPSVPAGVGGSRAGAVCAVARVGAAISQRGRRGRVRGRAVSWPWILCLAGGCFGLRVLGITLLGRILETRFQSVVSLMPAVLFPALVAVMTFEDAGSLVLDARAAGVVAGALAAWLRASLMVVIVAAMAATAGMRAIG